jgi:hypothetical protein
MPVGRTGAGCGEKEDGFFDDSSVVQATFRDIERVKERLLVLCFFF